MRFLRRMLAIRRMSRHERWRVRQGCPPGTRGRVYCDCDGCVRDRAFVGWDAKDG